MEELFHGNLQGHSELTWKSSSMVTGGTVVPVTMEELFHGYLQWTWWVTMEELFGLQGHGESMEPDCLVTFTHRVSVMDQTALPW